MDTPVFSSPLLGTAITLGNLSIWLGLGSALACVVLYWTAMLRTMRQQPAEAVASANGKKRPGKPIPTAAELKTEQIAVWARRFFWITTALAVVGSICLWTLIFTKQFNVHYIWKNTNNSLAPGFRFAAFWSDQEGTFFLWALYNGILGAALLSRAKQDERWVMPFFTFINVSLFTLLAFMNPFWLHPVENVRKELTEVMTEHGLAADQIGKALSFLPSDFASQVAYYLGWGKYWPMNNGRGLNEQLQNFWMVIHPPTLFVGYASMIIPGCFALGALMRRDYDSWTTRSLPWLMFGWSVLGLGIFLGAYWAYETLGWGGYWSWDPVENASIVPWVVGTALVHGLLAQRARGNFKQANLFLGVLTSNAVLVGSFLVRSGVLSETSVHSFASPQKAVFITLLSVMIGWLILSLALWFWRYKDIQSEIAYENVWERHFGFFLGLIVLSAIGIVIFFGVTLPLWLPKAKIDHTFYNKALLPVVFVAVLLMAITPLMPWRRSREEARPLRPLTKGILGLSAVVTAVFLGAAIYAWLGGFVKQNDPAYLAFTAMLVLSLVANGACLLRSARGGFLQTGPWVAHIGFILMLGGVMVTTRFKTVEQFQKVELNEPVAAFGREFIFRGQRPASKPTDRERLLIDMVKDGKTTELAPRLFVSKQTNEPMAWPQIVSEWFGGAWGDIYVVPSGVDNTGTVKIDGVKKNAEQPAMALVQHGRNDPEDVIGITFVSLDTSEMQRWMQERSEKPFTIYADVLLNVNGVEKRVRPGLQISMTGESSRKPIPLPLEGLQQNVAYTLEFKDTNLNPSDLDASFELVPATPVTQGYFNVMHVPGIQLLWLGCYLLIGGSFMCWLRRRQLARRAEKIEERDAAPASRPERSRAPRTGPEPAGAE